jgi:hypothetical protein
MAANSWQEPGELTATPMQSAHDVVFGQCLKVCNDLLGHRLPARLAKTIRDVTRVPLMTASPPATFGSR